MIKYFAKERNNSDYSGIDSERYLALRFFIYIIPNLVDIALTIISYDKNYKAYYIVRYASQALDIICCFIFALILSYNMDSEEFSNCQVFTIYCIFLLPFIVIAKEIPSLIFFIIYFDNLVLLSKIGYFIHFISTLVILIFYIIYCFGTCLSDYLL